MRITQQDIARLAECSQATVSRVLANDQRVEPAIRERVLGVIKTANYQPDARARSLRTRKTGLIGLVIKRSPGGLSSDPFFATLVAEIIEHLVDTPYHLCLEVASDERTHEELYDEMLRTRRVDGLILVETESHDERIGRLQSDNFPFVLIGRAVSVGGDVYSVDNDNVVAGELATRHLLNNGYERVGYLAGREGVMVSEDREWGYRRVVQSNGGESLIRHADFGADSAKAVALEWLAEPDRPDALVVLDDHMAIGVFYAARQLGLRVPDDLGVVAFNNSSICDIVEIGLSSVSLNIREIVRRSCDQLLAIIDQKVIETPFRSLVPVELIARGSSAGPRVKATP